MRSNAIALAQLQNQARYASRLKRAIAPAQIATYQGTASGGLRQMLLADGGIAYGQYLSNSQPDPYPQFIYDGRNGFINQRPV